MRSVAACLAVSTLFAASAFAKPEFHLTRLATPAEPDAIPLYAEGSLPAAKMTERWGTLFGKISPTLQFAQRIARNVSRPTITPVLPAAGKANGTAVVVAPGGGFQSLSMDREGFEIAARLAEHGIAAFVLKYRTNESPDDEAAFMQRLDKMMSAAASGDPQVAVSEPRAAVDALAALRMIRARAAGWHVDPARVGIIGFSAGAMTGLQAVLTAGAGESPAFLGYIYGPMTSVEVPAEAPPLFAALAMDDELFSRQGFDIVNAWRAAHKPVELHAYERGGHGFGVGYPGTTTALMMDEFIAWLEMRWPGANAARP